jgi:hypothetical protein
MSLEKFSYPVFPNKFLSFNESETEATYISKFKTYKHKLFLYESIKSLDSVLEVVRNFLLHFLNLPSEVIIVP